MLTVGLLAAGCSAVGPAAAPAPTDPSSTSTATAPESAPAADPDPETARACQAFWGEPDYRTRLVRDVLDRIATASEGGAGDPYFYSLTAEDITEMFERAPEELRAAADDLAAWFGEQAPQGADPASARPLLEGVARACADVSISAQWFLTPDGDPGTKPSALVCADVFDTPSTYTQFANANVLTSNMFALVGLTGRTVPADRMDDVEWTADRLTREAELADDDAVAEGLIAVRAPFDRALGGDMNPGGLQQPLEQLADACGAVGYDANVTPPEGDGDGGLV